MTWTGLAVYGVADVCQARLMLLALCWALCRVVTRLASCVAVLVVAQVNDVYHRMADWQIRRRSALTRQCRHPKSQVGVEAHSYGVITFETWSTLTGLLWISHAACCNAMLRVCCALFVQAVCPCRCVIEVILTLLSNMATTTHTTGATPG